MLWITESLNGKPQRYFIFAVCRIEVTSFILHLLSSVAGEMSGYIWILLPSNSMLGGFLDACMISSLMRKSLMHITTSRGGLSGVGFEWKALWILSNVKAERGLSVKRLWKSLHMAGVRSVTDSGIPHILILFRRLRLSKSSTWACMRSCLPAFHNLSLGHYVLKQVHHAWSLECQCGLL